MNSAGHHTKITFALLTILLAAACSKTEAPTPHIDRSEYVLQDNQLSSALQKLLAATNIQHDGSLPSVVQATQKAWLRKPGTERWHIGNQFEDLRDELVPLLKELDTLDAVQPAQNKYDYVLVLGATIYPVRKRLAYVLEQWRKGVRFGTLVFLVGARPLDPAKESKKALFDRTNEFLPIKADWQEPDKLPQTEAEMGRMVFEQADLPKGFKESVKVVFVDTPMQLKSDGTYRRPNTVDTIDHWLANGVQSGSVLAISNQPYVGYQHAALKATMPNSFTLETVGPQAAPNIHVGVMLDNIARWLYMENKLRQ